MVKKTDMVANITHEAYPQLVQLASDFLKTSYPLAEKLKGDGSERNIYRFRSPEAPDQTLIGITHTDLKENHDFLLLCQQLSSMNFPVPAILSVNDDQSAYLLQDLGQTSLADKLVIWKETPQTVPKVISAYKSVIDYLIRFQQTVVPAIPQFFAHRKMNRQVYLDDLFYYQKEFVSRFGFEDLNTDDTLQEINTYIISGMSEARSDYFVYRDFQSRNIMWMNQNPWFIDFQSAFVGPRYYDLASLLYGSKSNLTETERHILLRYYYDETAFPDTWEAFLSVFYLFVVARRLRSLGSYGYLSMEKLKTDFFPRIYPTLRELVELLETKASIRHLSHLADTLKHMRKRWAEIHGTGTKPNSGADLR